MKQSNGWRGPAAWSLLLVGAAGCSTRAVAAEPAAAAALPGNVDLARLPTVSPDGRTIVFSWRGDLWRVSSAGGDATRLTSHPADDLTSAFSPDGSRIAFLSNRSGDYNVHVMTADGAQVTQVTRTDRPLTLTGWGKDAAGNDAVLLSVRHELDAIGSLRPMSVPATGGDLTRLHDAFGSEASVSPDGSKILFTRGDASWSRRGYRGPDTRDVWLFTRADGSFKRLTNWSGNDGQATWIDNDRFVYLSDRSLDHANLYLRRVEDPEDQARPLTRYDDFDVESFDVSADGSTLVFARWGGIQTIDLASPAEPARLAIRAASEDAEDVEVRDVSRSVSEAALSPDGKTLAVISYGQVFVRAVDPKSPTRRVSSDVARHTDLAWSPDGTRLYFTSRRSGIEEIVAATVKLTRDDVRKQFEQNVKATTQPTTRSATTAATQAGPTTKALATTSLATTGPATAAATTQPALDPVRWADAITFEITPVTSSPDGDSGATPSPDGKSLAFRRGVGSLFVLDLVTRQARPIFQGWSDSLDATWSADSKWIAYVTEDENHNADIWIVDAARTREPVNVTRHPDNDYSPRFSADGRVLAFLSQRRENEADVYAVWLDEEMETLTPAELDAYYKEATAAARARKPIAVVDLTAPATQPTTSPTTGPPTTSPTTGPTTTATTGPATRAAAATTQPTLALRRALRSWLLEEDANAAAATPTTAPATAAARGTARRVALPVVPGTATTARDEKPKRPPLENPDLDDAYLRVRRITSLPGSEGGLLLAPAGDRFYFLAAVGSPRSLYVATPEPGEPRRVAAAVAVSPQQITPGGDAIVIVDAGRAGQIKLPAGEVEMIDIADRIRIDRREFATAKFAEAARVLATRFYHPTMKGRDWPALTRRYGQLAAAARTPTEFDVVFNRLLGELNASHLGLNSPDGPTTPDREPPGKLGIDVERVEGGFRVREVLGEGPAGKGPMALEVGDVLTAVEFQTPGPDDTLDRLLAGRIGEETVVSVRRGDVELQLLLTPVSGAQLGGMVYDDWRLRNARRVDELSGGKLGYIHVRGMDQNSLDVFERDLYAAAFGKKGLLIDVRNNGGGWTADRLLTSIMSPRHAYTVSRGMAHPTTTGYPQDRLFIQRYDLPINMLCNEKSFSNAEIVSHAFKTLKRGTLVGQQTAGGVISTGSASLVDGTTVRVPFRGWYLPDGTDMENNGAIPDLLVPQTPQDESAGNDAQLKAAIDDLLGRLAAE